MRIIAGTLGGRTFEAPPGHRTHPMSEKMRGALFNTLGDIKGLSVLDAFSGSGALSLEANSRGAGPITAVEIDKKACQTITTNLQNLQGGTLQEQVKVVRANISGWSDNNPKSAYDLVLADPPHDKLSLRLIQKLLRHVKPGGLLVLSWPAKLAAPELVGPLKLKTQNHGDAQLIYYKSI